MTTPDEARDMLDRAQVDGDLGLTAEMVARAPFMAEQIANMHYEYAVQNVETGKWVRECGGVLIYTSGPSAADWNTDLEETQNFEEWITDETLTAHRVVRRLVGEPEVIE